MIVMWLRSSAFGHGETMPKQHTADGPDLSPPLEWGDVPDGTVAFALLVTDPDAPRGEWTHWLAWDLPQTTRSLGQNVRRARHLEDGSRQGTNDFKKIGWGGPSPPRGPAHRYVFRLCALSSKLELEAGSDRATVEAALKPHLLADATLIGLYGRS
jgi:Raf kinase inhibitor-like YbhB/YbcL family protein